MGAQTQDASVLLTTGKILTIDGDEAVFHIVKELVKTAKGQKYDVHWSASYEAGREAIASDDYTVVLVDDDLGPHSGIELIREANERGYPAPFILFTGRGSDEIDVEAIQAGATFCLSKDELTPLLLGRVIRWAIERKQIETHLREKEERFRQLADAMPQLIWTARPDGTIDYVNQRYLDYDGVTCINGEHWDWTPAVHPDDLPHLVGRLYQAIQGGEVQQTEFRIRMADGSYRWHLSRGIPVKDAEGNVIQWFGTNTDIEDQKQTEDKLRRSNQELEQFAFVASHDLQEPLRKIRMFGSFIQQEQKGKLDEETQDNINRIISASERMQEMIQDLLELSRVNTQVRPFIQVNLSEVVAEVVSDLEPRMNRTGGRVHFDDLPAIEADPIQIHQVFQNLISNGLKFHKPDVPPIVRVSSTVMRSGTGKGQMASIRVADNGIGFEEQQFERIIQPFQRLHGHSEYEGNGIGLAIVNKIIERHQGEFAAQSTPGEGATFIVTLPVKQAR